MSHIRFVALTAALLLANAPTLIAQQKTMTTTTGIELVAIPPGEFMMGSTAKERAWALQKGAALEHINREGDPRKTVIKDGFWLGRTEVTMGQWKQFATASKYSTEAEKQNNRGTWREPNFGIKLKDKHPVCYITWDDAMAFCDWATTQEKASGRLPQGQKIRLPTEVEWEYACRAGKQMKYWWGDDEADANGRLNWHGDRDGFPFVSPVGSFGISGRNRFGLSDMLGNMWEWCLEPCEGIPTGRTLRGGSYSNGPEVTRCAFRLVRSHSFLESGFGFRVCCGVPR